MIVRRVAALEDAGRDLQNHQDPEALRLHRVGFLLRLVRVQEEVLGRDQVVVGLQVPLRLPQRRDKGRKEEGPIFSQSGRSLTPTRGAAKEHVGTLAKRGGTQPRAAGTKKEETPEQTRKQDRDGQPICPCGQSRPAKMAG